MASEPEVVDPLDGSFLDVSMAQIIENKTFDCGICGKVYKFDSNLKRHLKRHSSKPALECTRCSQFFKTEEDLNNHRQTKHSKHHLCVACGKSFMTKANLYVHIDRIHPGIETHLPNNKITCPYDACGKSFYQKEKYQDHLNVHSGSTPYMCLKCSRKFHGRYAKAAHEKICTGTISWTCEICNIDFSLKCALERHIDAQHTGRLFSCVCGQIFAYKCSLCRHQKNKKH